jgi:hypothetical protein
VPVQPVSVQPVSVLPVPVLPLLLGPLLPVRLELLLPEQRVLFLRPLLLH